jgi:hypothetical protein
MFRRAFPLLLPLGLGVAGCLGPETSTQLVPDSPFGTGTPAAQTRRTGYAQPQSVEAAARVDALGRQIVGANSGAGLKPTFVAIGGAQPEIFHSGTTSVFITEGLIKQCTSDGQLAAVLCTELGKMVAEREAKADPRSRSPEYLPPMDVPIGNDSFGAMGSADQTHLAELAKFQRERRAPSAPRPLPPDPRTLAKLYLSKAGYPESDLESVAPILADAAKNSTFEKQFTGPGPARPSAK